MPRSPRRWRFAVLPLVLAASASVSYSSTLAPAPLAGWAATSAPVFTRPGMADKGAADAARPLKLMVTLKLRDRAALDDYFAHLTTVGDPLFKHYLRPDQFAERFSPTMSSAAAVIDYLTAQGFTDITLSPNRTLIRMNGTVGLAQAAFNTQIHAFEYQGKPVLANVTPARVPAALGASVLGVVGLNTVPTHWLRTQAAGPAVAPPAPPNGTYHYTYGPLDLQKAYDVGTTPDGSNTSIAIIAEGDLSTPLGTTAGKADADTKTSDLRLYEDAYKLPHVPVTIIQTGADHSDTSGAVEWDLDTQNATGLAGNVKRLYVYDGAELSDIELIDEYNHFVTDNLAQAGSSSFGGCESLEQAAGVLGAYDQLFLQMASQGQTMFASTGDTGAECLGAANGAPGVVPGVEFPASLQYVIGVGGTTLTVDASGNYDTETVWTGSGGGTSMFEKAGAWQQPVLPAGGATGFKGVPDVAMDADILSQAVIYAAGKKTSNAGTSLASPLALGVWARLESARVTPTNPNPLGFAAPDLYKLGLSATAAATASEQGFHDIIAGSNDVYEATPGYDYASGLGTFDIAATHKALTYVSIPAGSAPVLGGDVCAAPGTKVALGSKGSNADAPTAGHNVLAAYYSEKYTAGQPDSVTFALDVDAITTAQTVYFVYFSTDDGVRHYVAYEPTPDPATVNAPKFTFGHINKMQVSPPVGGGTLYDVYTPVQDGTVTNASATGTRITWTLPRATIPAVAASKALTRIFGEADVEPGYLDKGAEDAITPVNSTAQGQYAPDAPFYCAPAPVAALTANPTSLTVGGTVTFSAMGSSAASGESLLSYSFDFGDGTASGFQPKASLPHTYTVASPSGKPYTATVTVIDSSGKQSTNVASQAITVTPPPPPTAFSFAERKDVPVGAVITSESITLAGTDGTSYPITVAGGTNSQYSVNGGPFTSDASTIKVGDKLVVRHTSAGANSTPTTTTVTVGGYATTFKSTTVAASSSGSGNGSGSAAPGQDHVPDAFDFGTQEGVAPSTPTASKTLTLTGYDTASVIAGQYVEYSVNGAAFTSRTGTLVKGETLQVRMTSNAKTLGYVKSYVSVGGVKGYFTVRTQK